MSPPYPTHSYLNVAASPGSGLSRSSRRNKSPLHIPRPRNAFMIYRADFYAKKKVSTEIERDHRHISRVIALCWKKLPDDEKAIWYELAEEEKKQHKLKYPNYRFKPVSRTTPVVRRKVKRNGPREVLRCHRLADFIAAGKTGSELESAIRAYDAEIFSDPRIPERFIPAPPPRKLSPVYDSCQFQSGFESSIFRSPLLRPVESLQPYGTHEGPYLQRSPCASSSNASFAHGNTSAAQYRLHRQAEVQQPVPFTVAAGWESRETQSGPQIPLDATIPYPMLEMGQGICDQTASVPFSAGGETTSSPHLPVGFNPLSTSMSFPFEHPVSLTHPSDPAATAAAVQFRAWYPHSADALPVPSCQTRQIEVSPKPHWTPHSSTSQPRHLVGNIAETTPTSPLREAHQLTLYPVFLTPQPEAPPMW